ncbi:unnamed protein product [Rotaria magnacalcarata]|uniref:Uncharacterized protein n=1 Tax=Rotaria magnacalcarata TaxID=392030 RepID=A0A816YLX5_9BILA|nr:unnamed protein product [Rotaria magnacalcarata]
MSLEDGLKPFHVIPKPLKSETHISDRLRLLLWIIKDKGEFWTGEYFRDIILTRNVFPFLKNEDNVIDPDEVIFVHDKALCMRANKTQHLLQENDVKFWSNDIWPGNSPDLNVAECIGSIIKDEVETKMPSETEYNRYHEDGLVKVKHMKSQHG